jgi:cell division transport system permease protein
MSQYGKSLSAKRSKPSYAYAIIGVALILFLFGIIAWFFLNLKKSGELFRENIQVHAWIAPTASKKQIDTLLQSITASPFVKSAEYISKEKAIEKWTEQNDSSWKKFLANNPLPESIDFYVKANYMNQDSLGSKLRRKDYVGVPVSGRNGQ